MNMNTDTFLNILILSKHSNEYLDRYLEPYKINSSYRIFVKKIVENPGISRDNLKTIVYVHPSNTTRALQYLEKINLITVVKKETDKRILLIYPTEELKKIYDLLIIKEKEWIDVITSNFTNEEKEIFIRLVRDAKNLSIKEIHY